LFFDVDPEVGLGYAKLYDAALRRLQGPPLSPSGTRQPGRVRLGFLSADLRDHVMGKMVWQEVSNHDRSRFALHFYALDARRDAWTQRFEGIADGFVVLADTTDREAAARIRADDIDVLIDLSTHTRGARPGIFALKPARVQITHVASAGTVGLSTIDFKLTDRVADAPGSDRWQIEAPLPIDGCVYPFRRVTPAADHPFRRKALGIATDAVLIGAFVTPLKLSRRCLALWREVLERVPRARIVFSPANPAFRESYVRLARAGGIYAQRLLFVPQGRSEAENQARYALIDLVLDPLPYGGVNGTLEALDMEVPVVALVGARHSERTSYSILVNLGVTQTVAHSAEDYVELAVRLAGDPAFVRETKAAIRAGLAGSPLTDASAHARNVEAAYLRALALRAPEAAETR
jgi:predicted O-linked N-acetylglucosamine transferase (SPINDLY family)